MGVFRTPRTGYTESGIVPVKDGSNWATVKYAMVIDGKQEQKEAVLATPAAGVYNNKSCCCSRVSTF